MRGVLAAVIASGLMVSDQTVANPGQAEAPFACVLTVAARTPPPSIMDLALSLDGLACGRSSISDAVTIIAPSQTDGCSQVSHDIPTSTRKSMTGLEAQELFRRCSPLASATRSGQVIALAKRTTTDREYGETANQLLTYVGWSAVPARYFISGAVGDQAVFCFETDGGADVPAYLEQAGFKVLDQFQVLRGTGTCREVVRAKLNIDISWRDGD